MPAQDNKSYCSYLWLGLSVRDGESLYPCCRFELDNASPTKLSGENIEAVLNSSFMQDVRSNALKGIKNSQCQKCYLEEEHGLKSERLTGLSDHPIEFSSTETSLEQIRHFEVFIGRTCNLKCHGCHPQLSTKWEEDYKIAQWPWEKPQDLEINYAQTMSRMNELQQLKIIGGEPALNKKTLEVLQAIRPEVRQNVTVEISTNGTQVFSPELKEILNEFKKVYLSISIDGPEKLNAIIRYPAKWQSLEKNVEEYLQWSLDNKNIHPILHCTVSSLNIFSLHQLEDWWQSKTAKTKNAKSRYALLTQPERLYIGNLPVSLQKLALSRLPNAAKFDHVKSLLSAEQPRDPKLFAEMIEYCQQLDRIRKTHLPDAVPELFL